MHSGMILSSQNAPSPTDFPSSDTCIPGVENVSTPLPDIDDVGNLESGIPGLDSFGRIDAPSATLAPSLASTDMQIEDSSQEQVTSLDNRSPLNSVPSVSADKSEELSPKAVATDVNSLVSSTATSVVLPSRLVLPKMIAPVVDLPDEQKDHLQISCFMRIIDAYKQISLAGGSKVRFSILAYLGVEVQIQLIKNVRFFLFSCVMTNEFKRSTYIQDFFRCVEIPLYTCLLFFRVYTRVFFPFYINAFN
jgi:symplekin